MGGGGIGRRRREHTRNQFFFPKLPTILKTQNNHLTLGWVLERQGSLPEGCRSEPRVLAVNWRLASTVQIPIRLDSSWRLDWWPWTCRGRRVESGGGIACPDRRRTAALGGFGCTAVSASRKSRERERREGEDKEREEWAVELGSDWSIYRSIWRLVKRKENQRLRFKNKEFRILVKSENILEII